MKKNIYFLTALVCFFLSADSFGQTVQLRGFSSASVGYQDNIVSFGFTEQDFLITSEINDKLSFLGEIGARFDHHSEGTKYSVEVQRVIMKYNYYNNHNILIGKIHNPVNYWNDVYHHGELFYPTVDRPSIFITNMMPMHTTGIQFQGHDLGKLRFGYDFVIGNGLGSDDIADNDKYKSFTVAAHFKPAKHLRIGASYYHDFISKGAALHYHANDQAIHEDRVIDWKVEQNMMSGHIAYFGKKFEFLCEGSLAVNYTDTTCYRQTLGSYLYTGYHITEKIIPYIRLDEVHFQDGEILFVKNNTKSFIGGIRYEISYLAKLKLEYEYQETEVFGPQNKVSAQITVGF